MQIETIFESANLAVMPFWLSMLVAPKSRWTARLAQGWGIRGICLLLATLYGCLIVPQIPQLLPLLARPDLAVIQRLLSTPEGATLGWIHYLCFDLWVGRWIWCDSRQRTLGSPLLRCCLFLTLMFGPLGLLSYHLLRGGEQPSG